MTITRHLVEVCEGANVSAKLQMEHIPLLPGVDHYLQAGAVPGGTLRNFDAYGDKLAPLSSRQQQLLCDPQTSGGLLVAVKPSAVNDFLQLAEQHGLQLSAIGELTEPGKYRIEVLGE